MTTATAVTIAATFCWIGVVVAISFIEAPLKFRAPGVTVPIGLGIGRLVFKVVNTVETLLAAAVLVALLVDTPPGLATTALAVAVVALAGQLTLVRPRLSRRSDAVLAGEDAPRSHAHHAYVGLECVKLIGLLVGGIGVLAAA